MPRQYLEAIGLEPESEWVYSLADGSERRMSVTTGRLDLKGEVEGSFGLQRGFVGFGAGMK